MADVSQIKLPNGDTYNLVDETSGYIKNYIETDPIFSASAAAGITSTDIANWNAKSDTDTKVTQTNSTIDADHRILLSASTNDTTETNTSLKNTNLRYNPSTGALKIKGFDSLSSIYKSINCDVSKAEITAQDSSLTTDSNASDWFQALMKAICVKYPSQTFTLFRGTIQPNTYRSYEVFIYDTSEVDSTTKLPRYSFGRVLGYGNTYVKFGTEDYVWSYVNVNTDTKVTQSVTTTSNWRKVLVHYSTNTAQDDVPSTITNQVYAAKGVEIQPSTGTLSVRQLNVYAEGTTTANTPAGITFTVKDTTTDQTYSTAYIYAYQDHAASTSGTNMVIRSGGAMFLGSGESPSSHYGALKGTSYTAEHTFITADSNLYIQAKGGTITDRLGFYLNTSHQLVPCVADTATNNVGSIGTSSYKLANLYVTNINGVAVGTSPQFTDSGGTVTSITLTQGDGISIGSSGTAITTSGSRTIALSTSGATAGSYGPSADASPAHEGTFKVPYVTVDKYGRVTAISTKTITLPASGNTDTKVTVAALTSGTSYYPILATGTGTATRQVDTTLKGIVYVSTAGEANSETPGTAMLRLGNNTVVGTANNEKGVLRLYGSTEYYNALTSENGYPAANRTIYLPSYAGTMYLVCASTTSAVGGSTSGPVYVNADGRVVAITSMPVTKVARDIICATGTANATTSLTSDTITQVSMTKSTVSNTPNSTLTLASNRISISEAGTYRITGSVYISTTGTLIGVYIRQGTGTFANATEIAASYVSGGASVNVTKTIKITSTTTQHIYLGARCHGASGTVANDNDATYLEVEQIL